MKTALLWLTPCVLTAALLAAGQGISGPPAKQSDLSAKVDKLFAKWDKPDSPGCAVAVIKDGAIVHKRGYGMASLEYGVPITASTLFLIASISKQFTAFLILLLAQGGRLSLDDDVRKHVPELPDFGKTITIRHLLHHTSGLRDQIEAMELQGRRFRDVTTREDFLEWLRDQRELNFTPGSEHVYCNTGYTLLGLVVERVSGKPMPAYAEEQLFRPLGMKHTVIRDHYGMVIKNSATSYGRRKGNRFFHIPIPFALPGTTNVFTTVEDLALWDRNFHDGKVGGKSILDLIQRKGKLNNGKEQNYAAGLNISTYRGLKTVSHNGAHGGFRSTLLRFPEQRFTVVILSNLAEVGPSTLAKRIADLYLDGQFRSPKVPKAVQVDPKTYDAYVGHYKVVPGWIVTVTRKGDRLLLGRGKKSPLRPLSETEFLDDSSGLRLRFVKTASGKVEKVQVESAGQQREGRRIRKELTGEKLDRYAGTFYSPELRVIYTVSVRDGKLRVRYPRGESVLQAWQDDEFSAAESAPFRSVQFTRSGGKQINALLVSAGRVRNVRFVKVGSESFGDTVRRR